MKYRSRPILVDAQQYQNGMTECAGVRICPCAAGRTIIDKKWVEHAHIHPLPGQTFVVSHGDWVHVGPNGLPSVGTDEGFNAAFESVPPGSDSDLLQTARVMLQSIIDARVDMPAVTMEQILLFLGVPACRCSSLSLAAGMSFRHALHACPYEGQIEGQIPAQVSDELLKHVQGLEVNYGRRPTSEEIKKFAPVTWTKICKAFDIEPSSAFLDVATCQRIRGKHV